MPAPAALTTATLPSRSITSSSVLGVTMSGRAFFRATRSASIWRSALARAAGSTFTTKLGSQVYSFCSSGAHWMNEVPSILRVMPQSPGMLAPGSCTACSPPAVHSWTSPRLAITQSRVRSAPHAWAAVAQRRKAEVACSPSDEVSPPAAETRSMYFWVAEPASACSKGMNRYLTYTSSAFPLVFHAANCGS